MIKNITTIIIMIINIIAPQPELNVSKKLSPFFRDSSPTIKAMIIIPINIDIKNYLIFTNCPMFSISNIAMMIYNYIFHNLFISIRRMLKFKLFNF